MGNQTRNFALRRELYLARLKRIAEQKYKDLADQAHRLMKDADGREREKLQQLLEDCETILKILAGKERSYESSFWEMYKRYAWAKVPYKGERATIFYRMRLFVLRLWDKYGKLLDELEATAEVQVLT